MESTILAIDRITTIESRKDELVEKVEAFFENREKNGVNVVVPIKKNQFENVCRMAMATTSVKEVINFIRYQIGRAKENEGWRDNRFGEELVKEIDAVAKLDTSVSIELVRLFLGFWNRHALYKRPDNN